MSDMPLHSIWWGRVIGLQSLLSAALVVVGGCKFQSAQSDWGFEGQNRDTHRIADASKDAAGNDEVDVVSTTDTGEDAPPADPCGDAGEPTGVDPSAPECLEPPMETCELTIEQATPSETYDGPVCTGPMRDAPWRGNGATPGRTHRSTAAGPIEEPVSVWGIDGLSGEGGFRQTPDVVDGMVVTASGVVIAAVRMEDGSTQLTARGPAGGAVWESSIDLGQTGSIRLRLLSGCRVGVLTGAGLRIIDAATGTTNSTQQIEGLGAPRRLLTFDNGRVAVGRGADGHLRAVDLDTGEASTSEDSDLSFSRGFLVVDAPEGDGAVAMVPSRQNNGDERQLFSGLRAYSIQSDGKLTGAWGVFPDEDDVGGSVVLPLFLFHVVSESAGSALFTTNQRPAYSGAIDVQTGSVEWIHESELSTPATQAAVTATGRWVFAGDGINSGADGYLVGTGPDESSRWDGYKGVIGRNVRVVSGEEGRVYTVGPGPTQLVSVNEDGAHAWSCRLPETWNETNPKVLAVGPDRTLFVSAVHEDGRTGVFGLRDLRREE